MCILTEEINLEHYHDYVNASDEMYVWMALMNWK